MSKERLLGTKQVADWLGVPEETLRYWRHRGDTGPPSFKLGPKRVVYAESDVERWIATQRLGGSTNGRARS